MKQTREQALDRYKLTQRIGINLETLAVDESLRHLPAIIDRVLGIICNRHRKYNHTVGAIKSSYYNRDATGFESLARKFNRISAQCSNGMSIKKDIPLTNLEGSELIEDIVGDGLLWLCNRLETKGENGLAMSTMCGDEDNSNGGGFGTVPDVQRDG